MFKTHRRRWFKTGTKNSVKHNMKTVWIAFLKKNKDIIRNFITKFYKLEQSAICRLHLLITVSFSFKLFSKAYLYISDVTLQQQQFISYIFFL